jgi:hypothetical protein
MNLHNVNRDAIDRILRHINDITGSGNYEVGDVALALAEYMGRFIVQVCDTPVSGVNLAEVMEQHIKRTLEAGYNAKGYNMGVGNVIDS